MSCYCYRDENPQVFPWAGRERFVFDLIPQLVGHKPGMSYDCYLDAALLCANREALQEFLDDSGCLQLDSIENNQSFPAEQRLRPQHIRQQLLRTSRIRIDLHSGSTEIGSNPSNATGIDEVILDLSLKAAKTLRDYRQQAAEAHTDK